VLLKRKGVIDLDIRFDEIPDPCEHYSDGSTIIDEEVVQFNFDGDERKSFHCVWICAKCGELIVSEYDYEMAERYRFRSLI
jgi:hypothetical protein